MIVDLIDMITNSLIARVKVIIVEDLIDITNRLMTDSPSKGVICLLLIFLLL
jgi:hypothetical protein